MAATFDDYFRFLDQLCGIFEKLTKIAREKASAVRHDDLLRVNECMKQEQVLSLSLRGMDQKREKMLKELGLSGVPLSGLAKHCPEELRLKAVKKEEQVRNSLRVFQSAQQAARTILECNLHEIEKYIGDHAPQGGAPAGHMADIRA